jgi:malonate decarboxylase acyl carrier protein
MALYELEFSFIADKPRPLPMTVTHYGVVGSGDLEVLLEAKPLNREVKVKIVTPVNGFDAIWQLVLDRFVQSSGLCDVAISINDNNATPAVVALRLQQALLEIEEGNGNE